MGSPAGQGVVLIVDDDQAIRDTLRDALELEGYPVALAANGQEALQAVEHGAPALILLDMRMPVMDGWTFARELKQRGRAIPILVMTAAQSARKWAEEVGARDFVAKPFDLDDLLGKVENLYSAT
jgi:CheY-like chemotaxis protein